MGSWHIISIIGQIVSLLGLVDIFVRLVSYMCQRSKHDKGKSIIKSEVEETAPFVISHCAQETQSQLRCPISPIKETALKLLADPLLLRRRSKQSRKLNDEELQINSAKIMDGDIDERRSLRSDVILQSVLLDNITQSSIRQELDTLQRGLKSILESLPQAGVVPYISQQANADRCPSCACKYKCHRLVTYQGRKCSIQISGLSRIAWLCKCRRKTFQMSLWKSIPSIGAGLTIKVKCFLEGGLGLQFHLTPQMVVPNTHPGFEILFKLERSALEYSEAKKQLEALFVEAPFLIDMVDPFGLGWIEKTLVWPWGPFQWMQMDLVRFLIENGAKVTPMSSQSLRTSLSWVGEGNHMDLLLFLLDVGLDPCLVEDSLFANWPTAMNPNLICETKVLDRFFVTVLRELTKRDNVFGGISQLQSSISKGSVSRISELSERPVEWNYRNFLGQSALHACIFHPEALRKLLENNFEHMLNTGDHGGTTPLMYVGAYGHIESAKILLEAGADPIQRDKLNRRNFPDYVLVRKNWKMLLSVLDWFQKKIGKDDFQSMCNYLTLSMAAVRRMGRLFEQCDYDTLQKVSEKVSSLSDLAIYQNGLLHVSYSPEIASLICAQSTPNMLHQPNALGTTAFMSLLSFGCPILTQQALKKGGSMHKRDNDGWNGFHYSFSNVASHFMPFSNDYKGYFGLMESLQILFRHLYAPRAGQSNFWQNGD